MSRRTYGTGTISREQNGTWRYRANFIHKNKRHRPSKSGFATKAAAREALNAVLGTTPPGTYLPPDKTTLRSYLDQWVTIREANENIRGTTASSYRSKIGQIPDWVGSVTLSDITADHLDHLYTEYRHGRSARSVRLMHTIIRKALQDAVLKKMVTHNVADAASPPSDRAAKAPEPEIWSSDEAHSFQSWSELPHYRRIAWQLALATGMRREDLTGLRWKDFEDGQLNLRNVRTQYVDRHGRKAITEGASKTESGRRVIKLGSKLGAELDHWEKVQKAQSMKCGQGRPAYVLTNNRALPWNPDDLGQAWRRDVRRAVDSGVVSHSMRLHDARHWNATTSIQNGMDLNTVAKRLGHANPAFTLAVYGHSDAARDQECADRLEAALGL